MTEKLGDDGEPIIISAGCYFLLAVVHEVLMLVQKGFNLTIPWWKYLAFAAVDCGGSYFTLLSLKFTTVTSWALIQPSALLLSVPLTAVVLHVKFTWKHIASAAMAVIGVVILVLSDASTDDDEDGHSSRDLVMGDFIAVLGAFLYCLSSIIEEIIAKKTDAKNEILTLLGVYGFAITAIVSAVLGKLSSEMFPDIDAMIYTGVASIAQYFYYASSLVVFALSGTAALEVCLLGINAWSVLGKITILSDFDPNPVFFPVALVTVILGVVLFTISGDPYEQHKKQNALLGNESPNSNST